jgi:hypothetical protein
MKGGARTALCVAFCSLVSACAASGSRERPSLADRRAVAQRFAQAIVSGNAPAAVALLVHRDDDALSSFVARAAAPWRAQHAALRLPAVRDGSRWIFGYAGTHTHPNGTFQQVRGDIAVTVAAARGAAAVELFLIRKTHVRFGTHHDSVLLPSNR